MSTLYEMTNAFEMLWDMIDDPDYDEDAILDTLEGIDGEIEDKADGYAMVIAEAKSKIIALKSEEARITARRRALENNSARLMSHLQECMERTGKTKFKTALWSFGIQNNAPSVVMDEPYIENIPEVYLIQQEPKLNKTKIKEDLKAGKNLEGIAHLEQSMSLRIR